MDTLSLAPTFEPPRRPPTTPETLSQPTPVLLRSHASGLLGRHTGGSAITVPAAGLGRSVAERLEAQPELRLAGALPFDRDAASHLLPVQAETDTASMDSWLSQQAGDADAGHPPTWRLTAEPSRASYEASVARCVDLLLPSAGPLRKVVLARTLLAQADGPINPWWLARRLGTDPHALCFVVPLPVTVGEPPAWLVGATPERLLSRHGARIVSEPLAGSAPRLPDDASSHMRADALLRSRKDQQEHRYVVEAIADLLTPLCRQLRVPDSPSLYATHTMWHLGTRIEGELKDASPDALPYTSSAALAALLHPTPAVGGLPRAQAVQTISELEPVPRGFYAGAVGWCNASGDGDWHIALRCARVQGREVRLFAGAGIVAGSSPAAEGAETRAKFNTLLHALGVGAIAEDL